MEKPNNNIHPLFQNILNTHMNLFEQLGENFNPQSIDEELLQIEIEAEIKTIEADYNEDEE